MTIKCNCYFITPKHMSCMHWLQSTCNTDLARDCSWWYLMANRTGSVNITWYNKTKYEYSIKCLVKIVHAKCKMQTGNISQLYQSV